MHIKLIVATASFALAAVTTTLAIAQPSQYFLWQNKKTGQKVCEPQAIDADWVKLSGPYEDPNCSIKSKE